jgi:hypothetical protein
MMRGISGAIVILMVAGGVIVYLAMEKFAPRRPCVCEEECKIIVNTPTPREEFKEIEAPSQPAGGVGTSQTSQTPYDDEWEKIERERQRLHDEAARLSAKETELDARKAALEEKERRLADKEQELNLGEAEMQVGIQDLKKDQIELIDLQIDLEDKFSQVTSILVKLQAKSLALEYAWEQVHQAEANLERLQVGMLILANIILIGVLGVFGLPILRRFRPQSPHTASSS